MKTNNMFKVLSVLLFSMVVCQGAIGAPSWTCSVVSAIQCNEDGSVGAPDLEGRERPTFLSVNVDKKEITLLAPESRRGEVTKIEAVHEDTDKDLWVFSGVEESRSWSMVISSKGHMTISVTDDGATWSVFGYAMRNTAEEE